MYLSFVDLVEIVIYVNSIHYTKDLDQTWQLPCIFYSMIQNYSHEEP